MATAALRMPAPRFKLRPNLEEELEVTYAAATRRLLPAAAGLVLIACASAASRSGYRPPELVSRDSRPNVDATASQSGRALGLRVEVEVDEQGRADLSTLELGGLDTAWTRPAVVEWLQSAKFRPATQDGVPVRGTFVWGPRAGDRVPFRVRRIDPPA